MRSSQIIMGTGVTVDIPGASSKVPFKRVFERLQAIDERFSTYKKDSEVQRFALGELAEADLSDELKKVIAACREAEARTGGYFSAWYSAPVSHLDGLQGSSEERAKYTDGTQGEAMRNRWFEPSGYVKGWAIAEAGKLIEKAGFATYCVSIGGDIMARSDGEKQWKIAIQDPKDRSKILDVLSVFNGAVCTSGNYARGVHIINPKTGKAADELASLSVTGPDIIWADVLATALFAMGHVKAEAFIKTQPAYRMIVVENRS